VSYTPVICIVALIGALIGASGGRMTTATSLIAVSHSAEEFAV
jgi:hypothetical protein